LTEARRRTARLALWRDGVTHEIDSLRQSVDGMLARDLDEPEYERDEQ